MTERWLGIAGSQAGAITAAQLAQAGVSEREQRRLARTGVLTRASRGTYLLAGTNQGWHCSLWLALLASGPQAFACRRSAAALWALDGVPPGWVEVSVPMRCHPRRAETIRCRSLDPGDVVRNGAIPLTSVARTLLDLGSVVDTNVVERSVESALRRRMVSTAALQAMALAARSPGARQLREVLRRRPVGAPPTESDAETLFLQIARSMALPDPRRQHVVILRGRKYRLDFAWPQLRLAIEIDGTSTHGPDQLGSDLRRQNQIVLDGWLIVRFTPSMIAQRREVARDLRGAWELRSLVSSWR